LRWYNNGTYGWIYTATLYAGKRYEEDMYISFDYVDLESDGDRGMIVRTTASWTEAWD